MNNFIISLLRDNFNLPVEIGAMICDHRTANFKAIIEEYTYIIRPTLWKRIDYMYDCDEYSNYYRMYRDEDDDETCKKMEMIYRSDIGKLFYMMYSDSLYEDDELTDKIAIEILDGDLDSADILVDIEGYLRQDRFHADS